VADTDQALVDSFIAPGGDYQVLFNQDDILVAKRRDA